MDIKETKELLAAVKKLSVDVIKGLKDGVQFDDINILIGNIDSIKVAIEGIGQVDDEIKDLDLNEVKELVGEAIDLITAVLAAVKSDLPAAVVE